MEVWRRFFVIRTISEVFPEYVIAILDSSNHLKKIYLFTFQLKCFKIFFKFIQIKKVQSKNVNKYIFSDLN